VNCRSIIKELANYFDEALDPILKTSIEKHLEGCEDCRIVVDTTRKTIQIFCNSEPAPLPEETKTRLRDALFKQLKNLRGGSNQPRA
jgi:predicted anti-sigma-YlaC factor YlaD